MTTNLTFLAGASALSIIREEGLRPDRIRVMAGAAGGPKWLILSRLDRAIFGSWLGHRTAPLFLIGSSIGSWRFAALCQKDPLRAIDRFEEEYIHQSYARTPTPEEVTAESWRIMGRFVDGQGISEVLAHPFLRLNILAARCRGPLGIDWKPLLGLGMLTAALANAVDRRALGLFFERVLFYDPRDTPPFFNMNGLPIQRVALNERNFGSALLSSGSIPLVMSGVRNIPGAPKGSYRDGAVVDYHLDLPFLPDHDGLVLYPHFMDRLIPGWFDKRLSWRRPSSAHMDRVVLVAPSREFVARLPYAKIPDRDDFHRFAGRDAERIAYWKAVTAASERLGEEFMEATTTGRIRELVRPMPS